MSYTIDFQRLAFKTDLQEAYKLLTQAYPDMDSNNEALYPYLYFGQYYLVFSELGDNNCICDDGKVARTWRLLITEKEPMRDIITHANDAESGYLRVNGRYTLAENYIRCYRKLIDEAIPTTWLKGHFPNGFRLVLSDLLGNSPDRDAAWRYRTHPHTPAMASRITEDRVNNKLTVNLCFDDPVTHALDMAWLFAVKAPGRRPQLDPTGAIDYKLSQIARAKSFGAYTPKHAADDQATAVTA